MATPTGTRIRLRVALAWQRLSAQQPLNETEDTACKREKGETVRNPKRRLPRARRCEAPSSRLSWPLRTSAAPGATAASGTKTRLSTTKNHAHLLKHRSPRAPFWACHAWQRQENRPSMYFWMTKAIRPKPVRSPRQPKFNSVPRM